MDKKESAFYKNYGWIDIFVFVFLMIIASVAMLWKCRRGLGNIDESFYLTIPYRYCQNDGMFIHEWHLSLTSAYMLSPIMKIYLWLTKGNTTGIILAFRYIYVFSQILAAGYIYWVLRKITKVGACISCFCWAIYAPFSISALSYNSMGIIFLTIALVMFACTNHKVSWILAGIAYSNAVLCCPYLAILLFLLLLISVYFYLTHSNIRIWKKFLWSLLGIFANAVIFIGLFFPRISLKKLFMVLPYMLNDPEHSASFISKIRSYFSVNLFANPTTLFVFIAYLICLIVSITAHQKRTKRICLLVTAIVSVIHLIGYIVFQDYINHLLYPINFLALICYCAFPETKIRDLFYWMWVPGMIYTFCLYLSSNQKLYSITSASCVPMVASIVIVVVIFFDVFRDNAAIVRYIANASLTLFFCILIGFECKYRFNFVFWDLPVGEQTNIVTEGPNAGLLVSEKSKDLYESSLPQFEIPDGNVLFYSQYTWYYLCGPWKNASYSAWLSGLTQKSIEKLENYYQINPDKWPDYIFVSEKECGENYMVFIEKWGYSVIERTEEGQILLSKIIN